MATPLPPPVIWFGGLLRCCTATVQGIIDNQTPIPVGTVIPCSLEKAKHPNRMVLREDGWHWLNPKDNPGS